MAPRMAPRTRSQPPHIPQDTLSEHIPSVSEDEGARSPLTPVPESGEEPLPETPTYTSRGKGKESSSASQQEQDVIGKGKASAPPRPEFKSPWDEREALNKELYSLSSVIGPFNAEFKPDTSLTYVECTRRVFHTAEARHVVFNDNRLYQRYQDAIRHGYAYLRCKWPDSKPDIYLQQIPLKFFRESMILDQISQGQMVIGTDGRSAYRVPPTYKELMETFNQMRLVLNSAKLLPRLTIPSWGRNDSDWMEYWRANDYEILATCFRKDAEDFIAASNQYFKREKDTGLLVLKETISAGRVKFGNQSSPFQEEDDDTMVRPSFAGSSISQANTFERMQQKNAQRFYGSRDEPTPRSSQTRSYLSAPTSYANTSSLNDIFNTPPPRERSEPRQQERQERYPNRDPGYDPSDSSDDDDGDQPLPRINRNHHDRDRPYRRPHEAREAGRDRAPRMEQPRFDLKLKVDMIPEWDGNPDTLGPWIIKINALSRRSLQIYEQLGELVPIRFRKSAEAWYYSLPEYFRTDSERDWGTMRSTIAGYYMNRS